MGNATQFTESLKQQVLSSTELQERREAALVREDLTTTEKGEIVRRVAPKVKPVPVYTPEPATWD